MTVITISRQYGSGGDEIAARLCKILDYQQFDKSLITKAAAEAGISEQEVYDYSEENHKVRSFLDRLFSRAAVMASVPMWEGAAGTYYPEPTQLSEEVMLTLVQKAILSAHETGKFVILGRGSQVLLRNHPDVLHLRIVAPLEDRIQRVKDELKLKRQTFQADVETRRDAQDLIQERDAASADYIKQYYLVDWAEPTLYHTVLNTGRLSLERATQIIVDLVTEY
jgi:cytidylate kinase